MFILISGKNGKREWEQRKIVHWKYERTATINGCLAVAEMTTETGSPPLGSEWATYVNVPAWKENHNARHKTKTNHDKLEFRGVCWRWITKEKAKHRLQCYIRSTYKTLQNQGWVQSENLQWRFPLAHGHHFRENQGAGVWTRKKNK